MSEEPQPEAASDAVDVVELARADLEAGREWKARERLLGHLAGEYDARVLELLGDVSYAMRDLPAAGAAWFGTTRRGAEVEEAIEAWRERYGDHFDQMWSSLPRSVRDLEGNKRVDALRRRAGQAQAPGSGAGAGPGSTSGSGSAPGPAGDAAGSGGGTDAATIIAVVLGVLFVACAVIGLVTLLGWLIPN